MINNMWNRIHLICGNHGDDYTVHMEPHAAASSMISQRLYGPGQKDMFYACPKYYPENRAEGEVLCRNHISVREYEKVATYICSLMEETLRTGGSIELVGTRWESKSGVEYRIIRQTEDELDVLCINRKGLIG